MESRPPRAVVGRGGPGDDVLEGGPGDDQLDGGDNDGLLYEDSVSYATRTQDITVDLAVTSATNGAAGEGDALTGIESATGGAGDDDIRGRDALVGRQFAGGAGDDRMRGSAGSDTITGGAGDDGRGGGAAEFPEHLAGGPGRDSLIGGGGGNAFDGGTGLDRYRCGGSEDRIARPGTRELLSGTCEFLEFGAASVRDVSPARFVGARAARQPLRCVRVTKASPCRGTLVVHVRGARQRAVGRGTFTYASKRLVRARVRLTRRGARLARRPNGVLVTTRYQLDGSPAVAWSSRLR